jgi:HNH endonuclease
VICEFCQSPHSGEYGSGRFCLESCSRAFSTKAKRKEINCKVSTTLTKVKQNKQCSVCLNLFAPKKSRQKYCTSKCRAAKQSADFKQKTALELAQGGGGKSGKYVQNPKTLSEFSNRTIGKILKRLDIGCSRCGWKEAACDIHHIQGRKIPEPNAHSNLTYLCPNCHRLFHRKKIDVKDIKTLDEQIGDRWKECYFG